MSAEAWTVFKAQWEIWLYTGAPMLLIMCIVYLVILLNDWRKRKKSKPEKHIKYRQPPGPPNYEKGRPQPSPPPPLR